MRPLRPKGSKKTNLTPSPNSLVPKSAASPTRKPPSTSKPADPPARNAIAPTSADGPGMGTPSPVNWRAAGTQRQPSGATAVPSGVSAAVASGCRLGCSRRDAKQGIGSSWIGWPGCCRSRARGASRRCRTGDRGGGFVGRVPRNAGTAFIWAGRSRWTCDFCLLGGRWDFGQEMMIFLRTISQTSKFRPTASFLKYETL